MPDSIEDSRTDLEPVVISGYGQDDAKEWGAYVLGHEHGTVFHTLRWRDVIRHTFKHKDRFLVARRGGAITGVLPVFEVSSIVFGRTLVSVPFGVYGGLLVDDAESCSGLVEHAAALAKRCKAKYVELRHLHSPIEELPRQDLYATFIADIPDSEEGCLQRIPRKGRAEVRKALKAGELTVEHDQLGLPEFHRLFSMNKRRLGSPLFPSSLFWHINQQFGDDVHILAVKRGDEVVSAVMSFIYKDTVMPYYSGAVPGAERMSANNFMYYELMAWASRRGLKRFDFGRSREGTGAYSFKKHQGFEPTPLAYQYILETEDEIPSLNPSNPKYKLAKSVFRHLPLWAAQKVGSWVVKRAPF